MNNAIVTTFLTLILLSSCNQASKNNGEQSARGVENSNPWNRLDSILAQIKEPQFPDTTFNVLQHGAIADASTSNTQAFNQVIDLCTQAGGGTVLVPEGKYLTGPIHLKSNVNLHLEGGAELLFSTNPADFPIVHTSFEGTELMNYSPLIYAYQQTNIAITGQGILNGQANASNWWPWKGVVDYGWEEGQPSQNNEDSRERLVDLAEKDVAVVDRIFGEGFYLRPSFIEPFECTTVLIRGIKIINAPFWVIHPLKSNNVIVDGVTIDSHGPNNDGCDPEYSKNVLIKNCTFNTGDDCIAIKSGRNADGRRVAIPTENVIVQNCKMIDGHGGVVMGSEISAGVRNVYVEDCIMDSPNLDRAIRIKSNTKRGGIVTGVYVRNITVGEVKEAVLKINMFYGVYGNQTGDFMPQVKNVLLENITVKNGGQFGILINGQAAAPVENIKLINVRIDKVVENYSIENASNIELIDTYMNGELIDDSKINKPQELN